MNDAATPLWPATLLAALNDAAGSPVDRMRAAAAMPADAPQAEGLAPHRGEALLAAWTGTQLHAGAAGLLESDDPDLALLVGDWCLAHALQALAQEGDLPAIGALSDAISQCALTLDTPAAGAAREAVWTATQRALADVF